MRLFVNGLTVFFEAIRPQRKEKEMEINELASELNKSTSEWLNAWTRATDPYLATEKDIVAFMGMAGEKRDLAQKLVLELTKKLQETYKA